MFKQPKNVQRVVLYEMKDKLQNRTEGNNYSTCKNGLPVCHLYLSSRESLIDCSHIMLSCNTIDSDGQLDQRYRRHRSQVQIQRRQHLRFRCSGRGSFTRHPHRKDCRKPPLARLGKYNFKVVYGLFSVCLLSEWDTISRPYHQ